MKKKLLLISLFLAVCGLTHAQLSGTYTIPGSAFPTIKSAIDSLNAQGVGSGGVVFNISAGYTETFATSYDGIITTVTSNESKPIIFQKSGSGPNPLVVAGLGHSAGTPKDAVFALGGTDYVTFDGINIMDNPLNITVTNQMETGFWLAKASSDDGTQHFTIKNCKISGFKKSHLIYSEHKLLAGSTSNATSIDGTNSYNKIYSDSLVNDDNTLSQRIQFDGSSNAQTTGFYDYGNEIGVAGNNIFYNTVSIYCTYNKWMKIANNTFTVQNSTFQIKDGQINIANTKSPQVYNNDIGNFTASSTLTLTCIKDAYNLDTVNIYNNDIHDITGTPTSQKFIGISEASGGLINRVYNNQIRNITWGTTSTSTGTFTGIELTANAAPTGAQCLVYNNTFSGNIIANSSASNVNSFIFCNWYGSIAKIYDNTITNNTTNCLGTTNIINGNCLSNNQWEKHIYGNVIAGLTNNGGTVNGIYHKNSLKTYIYKNTISGITSTNINAVINGIAFDGGSLGQIYNNYIYELYTPSSNGTLQITGMKITGGSSVAIHYNTIYLDATSIGTNFGTAGLYAATSPVILSRNNIIINKSVPTGTGITAAFRYGGTSLLNIDVASNTNNYFAGTPDATHGIFYDGTNLSQTLVDYQTRVYPMDRASISEDTPFENVATHPYQMHINPMDPKTQCESSGTIIYTPDPVTTDYYNTPRYPNTGYPVRPGYPPSKPDIGAEEFAGMFRTQTPPNVDLTPLSNTSETTNRTLQTNITDLTGVPTSGTGLPVLYWNVNNGPWQTVQATYGGGAQYNFLFGGGVAVGDSVRYYIVAQNQNPTPAPNVGSTPPGATGLSINPPAATTAPPTPFVYKVAPSACGSYTVGTGGDYPTLTAAFDDLNTKAISCPVTLLLTDAVYSNETFPITINRLAGLSSVNTLTIKPAPGVNASVQGSPATYILTINGANYVTIDGSNNGSNSRNLTFWNSNSATNAGVIFFSSPGDYTRSASNDVIKNCKIRASSQVTNVTYGILCNASSGGGYSNLIIDNNAVYSANIGIRINGTAAYPSQNCQVKNNIVGTTVDSTSIKLYNIYTVYSNNTLIEGNEVIGASQTGVANNNISGIRVYTLATNTIVKKNKVHGLFLFGGSAYVGPWGIFYRAEASSITEISNNIIYDIRGKGGNTGYYAIAGISLQSGGNLNIWDNSINLEGTTLDPASTSQTGCIVVTPAVSNVDIRNNILKNNMQIASGTSSTVLTYGIYAEAAAYAFSNLDNNDYYITGNQPHIGRLVSTNYATLPAWQAATGKEGNSLNVDPAFTSASDLHTAVPELNNAGVSIPAVTTDYAGVLRSDPPDIGAYEFMLPITSIHTNPATAIGHFTATLNGDINTNNEVVITSFEYGLTTAYGNSAAATPSPIRSMATTNMDASLTGLTSNTTYHFRAKGVSSTSGEIVYGGDLTFTTLPELPTVVTTAATGITGFSATLNGTVNANNATTNVTFEYGTTTAYGSTIQGVPASVSGTTTTVVAATPTDLLPNTLYHFRAVGTNAAGTVYGNDLTFSTLLVPPTVVTNPATAVTDNTCTLNGTVTANNSSTTVTFQYGTTTAYGTTVAGIPSPVNGASPTAVSSPVTGLAMNTTYHFRCVGVNAAGTTYGLDQVFSTSCVPPVITITGPSTACALSTGNVYTTEAGNNNYTWSISAGGTITSGAGTNTITVTWNTAGAQTVSVNYFNPSGCSSFNPPVYNVTVNPLPAPTISGPATVCEGTTGHIYSTEGGMSNYTWTLSSGGTIVSGAGSNSITVTWNNAGAQYVQVNYNNALGCSAAAPVQHNVNVNPAPTPTITGLDTVCSNSGYINYSTESGMTGYNWSLSSGGTISAGQGTNVISVTWTTPGTQYVYVNYANASGCLAVTPTSHQVTVNGPPSAAGSITGTSAVCAGAQGIAYSCATIPGTSYYVWTLPTGATIASGDGTNAITANYATNATSGNITVYGNNLCGNGVPSPDFPVTVTAVPAAAGQITGSADVCQGENGVVYSVPVIANATTYNWSVPAGATIVGGATTNSITVDFAMSATSGNVTVYGSNSCGNGDVSEPFAVAVNPIPETPTIVSSGDTLISNAAIGNQWQFEGAIIPGATGQTHVASQSGWYWTSVTLNGCESDTSNHIYILITSANTLTNGNLKIYPVPNDGRFRVVLENPMGGEYNLILMNMLGNKVFEQELRKEEGAIDYQVDIRPAGSGIYMLIVENEKERIVRKVIIRN